MNIRNKVFSTIGIGAFVVAVCFNINAVVGTKTEININLANLEALANGESGSSNCTYQAMAYCGGSLGYACQTRYTAESCRLYSCCPY